MDPALIEKRQKIKQLTALVLTSVRKLSAFRYPKLMLLTLCVLGAYVIFTLPVVKTFFGDLGNLGYLGIFIAGFLFTFGFTAPFAIGMLATLHPVNIFFAAIIGGCGALIGDLCIFKIIKISFIEEFEQLKKTRTFVAMHNLVNKSITAKIKLYLLYSLAGFIIASPLPDEIGITMLAGLTTIRPVKLALISLIFNTLGIFIILYLSQ